MAESAAASPDGRPLDEVMLAMDVVDTLRHRETLVTRELEGEDRDRRLIERLREIYKAQGIDVTDETLAEGVKALKESRFTYAPPAGGLRTALARLYVRRLTWAKRLGAVLAVVIVAWGAWYFLVTAPAERRAEQQRIEMSQTLPAELERLANAVASMTTIPEALQQALDAHDAGTRALEAGDAEAARAAIADLGALEARLDQQYELHIVGRPGETSGVWRIPDVNESARNYYLVVEALDRDGRAVEIPVANEETGRTEIVSQWGVRVPEATFERVRRDKEDDGIIQEVVLGAKRRGMLAPEYRMPVAGGAITEW